MEDTVCPTLLFLIIYLTRDKSKVSEATEHKNLTQNSKQRHNPPTRRRCKRTVQSIRPQRLLSRLQRPRHASPTRHLGPRRRRIHSRAMGKPEGRMGVPAFQRRAPHLHWATVCAHRGQLCHCSPAAALCTYGEYDCACAGRG